MQNKKRVKLPEPIRLWVELLRPDKATIVWWEPLDRQGTYFRVKTVRHTWLIKQEGNEIKSWRTTKDAN